MRQYTINVPQMRGARMMSATKAYNVNGLFTSGYSTCNIIFGISPDKQKMILIHADLLLCSNPQQIINDANWLGTKELHIILRETGHPQAKLLLTEFNKHGITAKLHKMDDEHDALFVTLEQQALSETQFHPHIKKLPIGEKPETLLCHPDEQRFLAVTKIQQLIGLIATNLTRQSPSKQMCIFDGGTWEPLEPYEFIVDTSHPSTKKEMDFFEKQDSFVTIMSKLNAIFMDLEKNGIPYQVGAKETVMSITFWLEGYFNNFDAVIPFKRNIFELFDRSNDNSIYKLETPKSNEDQTYPNRIVETLNHPNASYSHVKDLIEEYKVTGPETPFKKQAMSEITDFVKHYQQREFYKQQTELHQGMLTQAQNFAQSGKDLYGSSVFQNRSAEFFRQAFTLQSLHATKDKPELATLAYNTGRSLQKVGDFTVAAFFLKTAVTLSNYLKETDPKIQKYKDALKECETQIAAAQPSTTAPTNSSSS